MKALIIFSASEKVAARNCKDKNIKELKASNPRIVETSYETFPNRNEGSNFCQNLKYGRVTTLKKEIGHLYGFNKGN